MKLLVLLNEGAKGLAGSTHKEAVDRVARVFADAGADADVQCIDIPSLLQLVKLGAVSDADAIVIGGGDGLVAAAVNAVSTVGHKPIGVLPLGMNNHFAR